MCKLSLEGLELQIPVEIILCIDLGRQAESVENEVKVNMVTVGFISVPFGGLYPGLEGLLGGDEEDAVLGLGLGGAHAELVDEEGDRALGVLGLDLVPAVLAGERVGAVVDHEDVRVGETLADLEKGQCAKFVCSKAHNHKLPRKII